MSTISAGTTTTTALVQTGDTTGNLVLATGSVPTTALTLNSTTQAATFAGAVTAPSVTATAISTTGTINAANTFGFKNRIINGAQVIDQRNAGASVAVSNAVNTFITDRWSAFETTSGAFSWQQVSDAPTGFINSLKCTVTTANTPVSGDLCQVKTTIEGLNVADLAWGTASAKTVTLSFWVKSSLTGQFGGAFSNSDVNRSYPFTYTISAANTWEQKTVTVAGDTTGTWLTTNGIGMYVFFDMGTGSAKVGTSGSWAAADYRGATGDTIVMATLSATWQVTGVQLEVGSQATSFDFRSYGTELNLCQRYYQPLVEGSGYFHLGSAISSSQVRGPRFTFFQTMRTTPTITLPTAGTGAGQMYYNASNGVAASVGNFTAQQIKQDSFFLEGETWTGVSAGIASLLSAGSGGITIAVSAEL